MGVIDVDGLVGEISPDKPCGEDLEYDAEFSELERAAQGQEAHQMGDAVIEGSGPDWKAVKRLSLSLFTRTRDMRVAAYLIRALIHTDGFPGLRDGLLVLKGILNSFWEEVHPQLDPEDDNDPTFRMNTLSSFIDPGTTLRSLREAPLVSSKILGVFSMRDIQMANGDIPAPQGKEAPQASVIDGAFQEMDLEELQATAEAANQAVEELKAIEDFVTTQVGAAQAVDLSAFAQEMKPIQQVLSDQLGRRGVAAPGAEAEADAPAAGGAAAAAPAAGLSMTGEIQSREDAIRMLDKVIEYFNKYEPSSPIPLLLVRAKRLVSKSFMEIMQDLAPDGLAQAQMMGGVDPNQG
jgi:type VI secretion system protein ImpA